MTRCSDSCLVDGGFQLARGDPSFEFCVSFCLALFGSACVFAFVLGVASPVVVLFVVFNWIPRFIPANTTAFVSPSLTGSGEDLHWQSKGLRHFALSVSG